MGEASRLSFLARRQPCETHFIEQLPPPDLRISGCQPFNPRTVLSGHRAGFLRHRATPSRAGSASGGRLFRDQSYGPVSLYGAPGQPRSRSLDESPECIYATRLGAHLRPRRIAGAHRAARQICSGPCRRNHTPCDRTLFLRFCTTIWTNAHSTRLSGKRRIRSWWLPSAVPSAADSSCLDNRGRGVTEL